MLHAAIRAKPCPKSFVPYVDVETIKDSHAFDIASHLATLQLTGELFEMMAPEMEKAAADIYHLALVRVAALFGATVQILEDGSALIQKPDGKDSLVPQPPEFQFPRVPTVH